LIKPPKYYNMGHKHMHFQLFDIMNNAAQKLVKWQFHDFKDVTRFGSVIGIF